MNEQTLHDVIYSMITENTGRHMLDSGGAYGRHWERNSKRSLQDFVQAPPVTFKASVYNERLEFNVMKSLFHHLANNLELCEYENKLWLTWDKLHSDWSYSDSEYGFYNAMLERDTKWIQKKPFLEHGDYNPSDFEGEHFSGYTYNDENILSQDFVYYIMGDYVFIQTHNGCDARGGFSQPRLFKLNQWDNYLFDYDRYTIGCDREDSHSWDFDRYYENDSNTDIKLNDAEFLEVETEAEIKAMCQVVPASQAELMPEVEPRKVYNPTGKILVCDNKAYCPICGSELTAYTFDC